MKNLLKVLFGWLIALSIFTLIMVIIGAVRYQEFSDGMLLFIITTLLAIILFSFHILFDKKE